MAQQIPLTEAARADESKEDGVREVGHDLAYQRLLIVNVVYYGLPDAPSGQWVLIDAGLPATTSAIADAAASRFGEKSLPAAIILTHGHFDHVGALESLSKRWNVPVYAHPLELPYVEGRSSYPPPDPSVGGGMMATISPLYPRGPVDVSNWALPLPEDGSVPGMPGWRWIHTPGHTPGHVSLWRALDRTLIAGDAFITTAQESVYAVATQSLELHGPPMYYTSDWESAKTSVETLAALNPELAITGHGRAVCGEGLRQALHVLAADFDLVAKPDQGRYVDTPAQADETGVTYVPPAK
jgi:glyoxylase-like metal-dependent hydrolase (beta-lactamase superfamily II)